MNEAVKDFRARADRENELIPRVIEALRKYTGCSQVFIVGHSFRHEVNGRGTSFQSYARFAHTDYGPGFDEPFRVMLEHRCGMSHEAAQKCGLCIAGYWAPMSNSAYKDPLCLLDGTSHDYEKNTVPYYYRGYLFPPQKKEPLKQVPITAQTAPGCGPVWSPENRWVFVSDMTVNEAVIFKQYDWREGAGRAKASFHNSFHDTFHDDWKDCPGRRSVEVRALLVWDENGTDMHMLTDGRAQQAKL